MAFHVGQKVVCVDDIFSPSWLMAPNLPKRGHLYTIRECLIHDFPADGPTPCILLNEVRNDRRRWASGRVYEPPFWTERFRPVVERKTSISIFIRMLTPKKESAET